MQNVTSQLTEQQKWRHFALASLEVIGTREKKIMPYTTRSLLQTARFSNRHENNYCIINEPCAATGPMRRESRGKNVETIPLLLFSRDCILIARAHHKRSAD